MTPVWIEATPNVLQFGTSVRLLMVMACFGEGDLQIFPGAFALLYAESSVLDHLRKVFLCGEPLNRLYEILIRVPVACYNVTEIGDDLE